MAKKKDSSKELYLLVTKVDQAKTVLQKAGVKVRIGVMNIGPHFVPHKGLVFAEANLGKIVKILKSKDFRFTESLAYQGAQLNL